MSNSNEPVYNEEYAKRYNDTWINNERWKPETKQHIDTLSLLLNENTNWLDAGCGTGYFLSCFPNVRRTGFDKSEAMLQQARKANPGIELKEIDLRERVTEWEDKWDLVSCTGQPWSYLPVFSDIYTTVCNLSAYTKSEGKLFITMLEIEDYMENNFPKFYNSADIGENMVVFNGIIWSITENGTHHKEMILPNLDQWIRWLSEFFIQIEILRWTHDPPHLRIPRRSLLCSIKRQPGDKEPSKIIEHPIPVCNTSQIVNKNDTKIPISKPWEFSFWKKLVARGFAQRKK